MPVATTCLVCGQFFDPHSSDVEVAPDGTLVCSADCAELYDDAPFLHITPGRLPMAHHPE